MQKNLAARLCSTTHPFLSWGSYLPSHERNNGESTLVFGPSHCCWPSSIVVHRLVLSCSLSHCHWAVRVVVGPAILLFGPFALPLGAQHRCLAHRKVVWPTASSLACGVVIWPACGGLARRFIVWPSMSSLGPRCGHFAWRVVLGQLSLFVWPATVVGPFLAVQVVMGSGLEVGRNKGRERTVVVARYAPLPCPGSPL